MLNDGEILRAQLQTRERIFRDTGVDSHPGEPWSIMVPDEALFTHVLTGFFDEMRALIRDGRGAEADELYLVDVRPYWRAFHIGGKH